MLPTHLAQVSLSRCHHRRRVRQHVDQLPLDEPASVRRVPHENVRCADYFDRKENLA
jgi:hypothetical protein